MNDPFILAGREYRSRLIVGTGKYRSFAETRRQANISQVARKSPDAPDFSELIRR